VNDIERWLRESARLKLEVAETQSELVQNAAKRVAQALREGNRVYLMGNGGSAADAQHIAGELINRFLLDRGPLPVMALTTDTSVITSVANDYGFAEIFSKQIAALCKEGDVVWGMSTSGNSPNVVTALRLAREMGAVTVGLTGKSGGEMVKYCDYCVCVPSTYTPWIQETHIALGHAICDIIERTIFEGSHTIGGF
jgi:D-sedoheptulose 7-phosphate isomerase